MPPSAPGYAVSMLTNALLQAHGRGLDLSHRATSAHVSSGDEWSSIMGWVSVACWVVVYSPQIWENYVLQSGEGLSVAFVVVWLLGDVFNLIGAIQQGLLWTMIVLAAYYTLCDIILLFQVYYYRWKDHRRQSHSLARARQGSLAAQESATTAGTDTMASERTPLLPNSAPSADHSVREHEYDSETSSKHRTANEFPPAIRSAITYFVCLVLVAGVGVMAWYIKEAKIGRGAPKNDGLGGDVGGGGWERGTDVKWRWDAQVYGWASAVLYLGSRMPQIFKNKETKCEGLSFAMFFFAVAGNATYVASILFKSVDRDYLVANASWLAGSGLTILLDFIVLGQFFYYAKERRVAGGATS